MMQRGSRFWMAWAVATFAATVLLGLALLPPFVGTGLREGLMHAFAPLCHQMPSRSLHVHGVPTAVCDRCLGIYLGLPLGGLLLLALAARVHRLLHRHAGPVLAVALLPLGLDWIGPVLGTWPNTPVSRTLTGLVFGLPAGLLFVRAVTHALSRRRDVPVDEDGIAV